MPFNERHFDRVNLNVWPWTPHHSPVNDKTPGSGGIRVERTTGFEPATLTLATEYATCDEENARELLRKARCYVN